MIATVATGAAWVLGAVLVWAAGAKALRPAAARTAFAGLGVRPAGPVLVAVIVAEVVTAGALVAAPRWGGAAAVVLLAAFSVVLGRALARGAVVSCACFGASPTPVTVRTLIRNAGLVALAGLALLADGTVTLPGLVSASAVALLGAIGLALADLVAATGRLWSTDVPDAQEPGPGSALPLVPSVAETAP